MINISRGNHIFFYVIVLGFVAFFIFYFYNKASVTSDNFSDANNNGRQSGSLLNNGSTNINTQLFTSEKFRNLRSDVAPIQIFKEGKENPFKAY